VLSKFYILGDKNVDEERLKRVLMSKSRFNTQHYHIDQNLILLVYESKSEPAPGHEYDITMAKNKLDQTVHFILAMVINTI
jgi:hypothetical protein